MILCLSCEMGYHDYPLSPRVSLKRRKNVKRCHFDKCHHSLLEIIEDIYKYIKGHIETISDHPVCCETWSYENITDENVKIRSNAILKVFFFQDRYLNEIACMDPFRYKTELY